MKDIDKTKEELISELSEIRKRVAELEQISIKHKNQNDRIDVTERKKTEDALLESIDITEIKRSEEAVLNIAKGISELETLERSRSKAAKVLREREKELKSVIESTNDGFPALNSLGHVIYSNRRFAEMWSIPARLLKGRNNKKLLDHIMEQLKEPDLFLSKVHTLHEPSQTKSDTLFLKDGRIFEHYSNRLV